MARKQESVYKIKVLGLNDVKSLNTEIEKLNGNYDKLSKESGKASKSTGDVGKTSKNTSVGITGMTKAIGAATIALVAFNKVQKFARKELQQAFNVFKGYEFQMQKVKAISGATTTEFTSLNKTAQELGRSTFFTAEQVAALQLNFSKLGFTASEVLNVQQAALLAATATGEDLARTATVIGSTIRGFGLDASEGARVADVMAASFTSSALTLEKFQTSMTKVSPVAKLLGMDLEETTAVMGVLTDAGIEASIAGTSLRNIFLKLGDPSSDLAKSIGFTVNSGEDMVREFRRMRDEGVNVEKMLKVVDVRQVAAISTMIEHIDKIEEQTEAFRNSSGAASDMAGIIGDSLQGAVLRFQSAIDGLRIVFVDAFAPALQGVIDGFASFFNSVAKFLEIPLEEQLARDAHNMDVMFQTLQRTNIEQETRNRIISRLNREYKDYLPNLLDEESTLDDIKIAQDAANKSMETRINMMAAESKLLEIKNRQLEIEAENVKLFVEETNLQNKILERSAVTNKLASESFQGVDKEMSNLNLSLTENTNKQKANRQEAVNLKNEYDVLIKAYSNLGGSVEDLITKTGGGNGSVEVPTVIGLPEVGIVSDRMQEIENAIADKTAELQQQYVDGRIATEGQLQQAIFDMKFEMYQKELELVNMSSVAHNEAAKKLLDLEVKKRTEQQKSFEAARDGYDKEQQALALLQQKEDEKIQNVIINAQTAEEALANLLNMKINEILLEAMASLFKDGSIPFLAKVGLAVGMKALITPLINNLLGGSGGGGSVSGDTEQSASVQFEKGGLTRGGMFQGASHANGGVKFRVGGTIHEAEGGEAIINKRSTARFRPILSAINSYNGNGVKFADGGIISQGEKFAMGGELRSVQSMVSGSTTQKVVLVESDVTETQNRISALESQSSF
jgi:TP901 family phage tail tape measure protein